MSREPLLHADPPTNWWEPYFGNFVHVLFVSIAALLFAVPIRAQRDGVLYEKVREMERHLDNSDQITKETKTDFQTQINKIRERADEDHETIDEYRFVFIAAGGVLTFLNLLGLRVQFNRGKESNG